MASNQAKSSFCECPTDTARANEFFNPHIVSQLPDIRAILFGGSRVYGERQRVQNSDWDGVILVSDKIAMLDLIATHRSALMSLLYMTEEENPSMPVSQIAEGASNDFNAIRFVGKDQEGIKRSVQILSLECLRSTDYSLRKLSFKDKRIYSTVCHKTGVPSYLVQQTVRYASHSVRHDQWIYTFAESSESGEEKIVRGKFGITADLILTGVWVHDPGNYGAKIKKRILERYIQLTGSLPTLCSFARAARFSASYTTWFLSHLFSLLSSSANSSFEPYECRCPRRTSMFLGPVPEIASDPKPRAEMAGFAEQSLRRTPDGIMSSKIDALMENLSKVDRNSVVTNGDSPTQAGLMQQLISDGGCDDKLLDIVLSVELRKADEILRAYCTSLTHMDEGSEFIQSGLCNYHQTTATPGHNTVLDDCISHITSLGSELGLESLLDYTWTINGGRYSSLRQVLHHCDQMLCPDSLLHKNSPMMFGPGSADGRNIIVTNPCRQDGSDLCELVYSDCNNAGGWPLIIDLAKQLYVDVLFSGTDEDDLLSPPTASRLGDEIIVVDLFSQPIMMVNGLNVRRAIFEIKRKYLLDPLRDVMGLDGHVETLAGALCLNAMMDRRPLINTKYMVRSMAIGIQLANVKSWEELYACVERMIGD